MRTSAQLLPPTEGGYLSTMELNFNEADFLMHCIELFVGHTDSIFMDDEMKEVMMDPNQINGLFLRIQEAKFERD